MWRLQLQEFAYAVIVSLRHALFLILGVYEFIFVHWRLTWTRIATQDRKLVCIADSDKAVRISYHTCFICKELVWNGAENVKEQIFLGTLEICRFCYRANTFWTNICHQYRFFFWLTKITRWIDWLLVAVNQAVKVLSEGLFSGSGWEKIRLCQSMCCSVDHAVTLNLDSIWSYFWYFVICCGVTLPVNTYLMNFFRAC
jgi:hypothetical protein